MHSRVALILILTFVAGCGKKNPEEQAMTPRESLAAMHVHGDFHVELFAAEPDVMSPVEMVFDENDRIYVAEMLDYPDDPPAGNPARSRIRLLEDTDGDGKIDRSTVFADNVLAVSGILPWKGGLIVTSAPDILYLKDTNGDGKADVRKVLYTGFPKSNQESRITNPRLSTDNWIYCSNSGNEGRVTGPDHPEMPAVLIRGTDFRFDPLSGRFEAASGPANSVPRSMISATATFPRTRRISGTWWCRCGTWRERPCSKWGRWRRTYPIMGVHRHACIR